MRTSTSAWTLSLACLQSIGVLGLVQGRSRIHKSGLPTQANHTQTFPTEYIELAVNQFEDEGNKSGTFLSRFWVRDDAYKPGAPIFLFDIGEQSADGMDSILLDDKHIFKPMVDRYKGIGIVWEHRFYGNSTPVNISISTPAESFRYHSTDQALADVDAFAWSFSRKNISYDLSPVSTPWVFVGGSYSGMRAAFMRELYPQTIYASFASSAPVQAQIDMSAYFEPIVRGLTKYGYGNCTKDIHAAIVHIDNILDTNETASSALKEQFLGLGAANNTHSTFADALAVTFDSWQTLGAKGELNDFCNWLSMDPECNTTAPAEGFAPTKGAQFVVDRWASYSDFVPWVNATFSTNCTGSATEVGDCNLDQPFTDPDQIAWTWQICTEWGFFHSANLGPTQLLSKHNSLAYQSSICHRQWPHASPSLLPPWPAVTNTNALLGGWTMRPSQVYWSGGEFDPWRVLSPLSGEPWAPRPVPFTEPPECGVEQGEGSIFGYVMEGAQHCYDFDMGTAEGERSRGFWYKALDRWLGCFGNDGLGPEMQDGRGKARRRGVGRGKAKRGGLSQARGVRRW